jgi:hypothetical protein
MIRTATGSYRSAAAAHRDRVWAVEAAAVGLSLAQRVVADGERVPRIEA